MLHSKFKCELTHSIYILNFFFGSQEFHANEFEFSHDMDWPNDLP